MLLEKHFTATSNSNLTQPSMFSDSLTREKDSARCTSNNQIFAGKTSEKNIPRLKQVDSTDNFWINTRWWWSCCKTHQQTSWRKAILTISNQEILNYVLQLSYQGTLPPVSPPPLASGGGSFFSPKAEKGRFSNKRRHFPAKRCILKIILAIETFDFLIKRIHLYQNLMLLLQLMFVDFLNDPYGRHIGHAF